MNLNNIYFRGFSEYGNSTDDSKAWSVKWELGDFDEFLFASGNKMKWLRASKYDIIGSDGLKEYSNKPVKIIASDKSCDPSTGKKI